MISVEYILKRGQSATMDAIELPAIATTSEIIPESASDNCIENTTEFSPDDGIETNFPSTDALATAINKNCTLSPIPLHLSRNQALKASQI